MFAKARDMGTESSEQRRDRRASSFRKNDVIRAIKVATAAGIRDPVIAIDPRTHVITITPGRSTEIAFRRTHKLRGTIICHAAPLPKKSSTGSICSIKRSPPGARICIE
jgi:hypothetical protein